MVFNAFMVLKPFYFYVHAHQPLAVVEEERLKGIRFYAEWLTNYEDILGVILLLYWPLKRILHFTKIKRIPNGSNLRSFCR